MPLQKQHNAASSHTIINAGATLRPSKCFFLLGLGSDKRKSLRKNILLPINNCCHLDITHLCYCACVSVVMTSCFIDEETTCVVRAQFIQKDLSCHVNAEAVGLNSLVDYVCNPTEDFLQNV